LDSVFGPVYLVHKSSPRTGRLHRSSFLSTRNQPFIYSMTDPLNTHNPFINGKIF
jgi:hypothetical protein